MVEIASKENVSKKIATLRNSMNASIKSPDMSRLVTRFEPTFYQVNIHFKTSDVNTVDKALGAACLASARTEAVEGEQRILFMRKCLGSENSKPQVSENQRFSPVETETDLVSTTTATTTTTTPTSTTTTSTSQTQV